MAEPKGYCTHCNDACLRCSSDEVFEDPEERAAVVRYLRERAGGKHTLSERQAALWADAIERGEHRR